MHLNEHKDENLVSVANLILICFAGLNPCKVMQQCKFLFKFRTITNLETFEEIILLNDKEARSIVHRSIAPPSFNVLPRFIPGYC